MTTAPNPFRALGLPERPDLTDEQVRAAWRNIAAATHPDRPDGGDLARYTAASAAYAELRVPWGRSEAYADLADRAGDGPATAPIPVIPGEELPPEPPWQLMRTLTRGRPRPAWMTSSDRRPPDGRYSEPVPGARPARTPGPDR